jgi:hypothetical protein
MNTGDESHVTEDALEAYALRKLSLRDVAPLEEHLLICPVCQTRLDEVDEYVRAAKAAAAALSGFPLRLREHPTASQVSTIATIG